MIEPISEMRKLTTAFLIAQPNAGMPKIVKDKTVYQETPDEFKRHIPALIKAGANIVGGCCGTTPEHIKEIKKVLQRRTK
jgi:5-methyltetrahydrofolate--homocysteine methyltransferase